MNITDLLDTRAGNLVDLFDWFQFTTSIESFFFLLILMERVVETESFD